MTTTKRAKSGGETGMNGEFYAGGTFLPNTTLTKMARSKPTGSGKVEIEPFVWVASEGRKSLYRKLVPLCRVDRDGVARIIASEDSIRYYGETYDALQMICDRYNQGERWL